MYVQRLIGRYYYFGSTIKQFCSVRSLECSRLRKDKKEKKDKKKSGARLLSSSSCILEHLDDEYQVGFSKKLPWLVGEAQLLRGPVQPISNPKPVTLNSKP